MKLRQMEALRAVVRSGTTKDAGDIVSLTQSAVSKLISQLEDELNVSLFFRRSGRLVMTPEGRMIYEDVERVLTIVDELREKTRDSGALRGGKLRVGTMPALGHGLLPRSIRALNAEYPNLLCVIDEQPRQRIEDQIASGYYDLGFVTLPVQNERLEVTSLGKVSAVCVMSRDHPKSTKSRIDISDLENEPFISVDPETLLRHRTDSLFGENRVRRRLTIQTQSTSLACQMVAEGNGVAIVHPLIALSLADRIAIKPFKPDIQLRYAIINADGGLSQVAKRLREIAVHEMEEIRGGIGRVNH